VQGTYLWDQAGRLESIVYTKPAGDVLSSFSYSHDAAGNRLSKTFASGGVESYGYDALNRLTSASYPSGREVQYDYDPVGNRNFVIEQLANGSTETTTYTYSAFNQVLTTTDSQGTTSYGWDDNGNLVGKQTPSGAKTLYSYNHANRLVEILYPNGHTNHFGYDPQGIRTYKQDAEGTTHFLIDRVSVLATYDGAGTQKSWLNHNPQRIDEIISQTQEAGLPGGDVQTAKLYHLVDGLGSVYGLVNQAGVKVASYGYDAYGAVTDAQVEPGLQNNWLFTGRELDVDSGWQYNRARYYLSAVGAFSRIDPLPKIGVPSSLFQYAEQNPTKFSDPNGTCSIINVYNNWTQLRHLGYSFGLVLSFAVFSAFVIALTPLGAWLGEGIGQAVFISCLSMSVVGAAGVVWEWKRNNAFLEGDAVNDLIFDAAGVVLAGVLVLIITGFVYPKNLNRAYVVMAITGMSAIAITEIASAAYRAQEGR
jgi:RHS repeat-associated protein